MSEVKDTQQHPKVEISVKNFGPIAEANIDLRPLTVFVGPSNTGKTYFATLVYALHGVFNDLSGSSLLSLFEPEKHLSFLGELLEGVDMPKEDIQDMLKKLETRERPFKLADLSEEMRKRFRTIIKDKGFFTDELQDELKNCFDLNSVSELSQLTGEQRHEMTILMKVSTGGQECWNIKMKASESRIIPDISTNDDSVLLPKGWTVSAEPLFFGDGTGFGISRSWIAGNRYYLPAARSGIMQSHRIIVSSLVKSATRVGLERLPEVPPTLPGVIAEFMQQIILYDEDKEPAFRVNHYYSEDRIVPIGQVKPLADTLELDVLAGQIRVKSSSSGYPDFRYLPQGTNEEIRLSQSSSMVSELAPLVLYLRGLVKPGDTLIIEEPEAHLHPGAQADMAVILARLTRAGVRVIITTHSDWLLEEIGNLILEGLLEEKTDEPASWLLPEEVGAWHFQKDKPVKEIAFDAREGISPKDFEDVAEGLYNRSVNLQQRFEKKKGEDERESS